jgi:FG-GAP repeat
MRLRLASLLMMAAAAGCHSSGTADPCGGMSGVCVTAHVEGNVTGLEQLRFVLLQPSPAAALVPDSPSAFSLPVKVGIVLPAGAGSNFDLQLEGLDGSGTAIAFDSQHVDVVSNRAKVTFTLDTGTAPDLAQPKMNVDMAHHPDLNEPIILTSDAPDGGATAYELEQLSLKVTATDPLSQQLTLSVGQAPDAGVATQTNNDTLTFTWTPSWDEAGVYPMHTDCVSKDDATRHADLPTPLHVINSVDPALIINPADTGSANPIPPVAPIGDFDGDGFADVAGCSVALAGGVGSSANYSVFVLFGDANGLPTAMPPMARIRKYAFAGTSTNAAATRLTCVGADIDGDGKSDILVSDPNAAPNGTDKRGQIWILFGNSDRMAPPVTMGALLDTAPAASEQFGRNPVFVGDFNGDNIQDFATMTTPTPNDVLYIFLGANPRKTAPWSATTKNSLTGLCTTTANRSIVGANDLDHDGKDEIVLYDPNVNFTGANCGTTAGGLSVVKNGQVAAPTPAPIARPVGTTNTFASSGSTICDVNGDGNADLLVPNPGTGNVAIWFAPLASPLPSPAPFTVMPRTNGLYSAAKCVKTFFGPAPQTTLLADTAVSLPVRVDVLTVGNTPMVMRQLPVPDPNDMRYGEAFGPSADVNGDGKQDLEVGNSNGTFWIVYGR